MLLDQLPTILGISCQEEVHSHWGIVQKKGATQKSRIPPFHDRNFHLLREASHAIMLVLIPNDNLDTSPLVQSRKSLRDVAERVSCGDE
jgi:hypothetical protein